MTDRDEWLEERRGGIGGSDVAAILGLSKWSTPLDIYRDKIGEGDNRDTPAMEWGRRLEPAIRQAYADRTGEVVEVAERSVVRHPEHAHMIATVDGITASGRLLEVKTARTGAGWGEEGTADIPLPYMMQIQHYLCVTGLRVCDVAVLIGGSDFRVYVVEADDEIAATLIEEEAIFWRRVQDRDPPAPVTYADAVQRFPAPAPKTEVRATPEVTSAVHDLRAATERMKELELAMDSLKALITAYMGSAETLTNDNGAPLASWSAVAGRAAVDVKAMRAAYPEIVKDFTTTGAPTRRFALK